MKWTSGRDDQYWHGRAGVFEFRVWRSASDPGLWFWDIHIPSPYELYRITAVEHGEASTHHEAMKAAELVLARVLVDALLAVRPDPSDPR